MFKKVYLAVTVVTFTYLLFFDGFNYSHGNWITHVPASGLASALWPAYWGYLHWMY